MGFVGNLFKSLFGGGNTQTNQGPPVAAPKAEAAPAGGAARQKNPTVEFNVNKPGSEVRDMSAGPQGGFQAAPQPVLPDGNAHEAALAKEYEARGAEERARALGTADTGMYPFGPGAQASTAPVPATPQGPSRADVENAKTQPDLSRAATLPVA